LFFVVSYSGGDGFEGGTQGGDLIGEAGQGAAGVGAVALLDDRAQGGIAVEGGAAQTGGGGGDGGEGDWLAVVVESGAGGLDSVEDVGGGYPVRTSLISVSS
jgi:hypothetical protein